MKFLHHVVAHQGGWDEILLVVAPLGLIAWLLWGANRKAEKMKHDDGPDLTTENDSISPDN